MNRLIENKLKNKIKEAEKNKSNFFTFEPEQSFRRKNLERRNMRMGYFGENSGQEIEQLKKEEKKVLGLITYFEEDLYKENSLLSDIYVKNNKLYFFKLEIYLNDVFLIIKKEKGKKIYINLSQGLSFDYEYANTVIKIKNNELIETCEIDYKKTKKTSKIHIKRYNEPEKYCQLLLDLIEIIITNRNSIQL